MTKCTDADDAVGTHRVDDVLRVGPRARIVVDLGADREAHAAPQPFGDDRRVRDVDAGGFGRAVQIAGMREFERAAYGVHGAGVFERQVVDVVGHHQEARRCSRRQA